MEVLFFCPQRDWGWEGASWWLALAGPGEARRCSLDATDAPEGSVEARASVLQALGSPCDDAWTVRGAAKVAKQEKAAKLGEGRCV